MSTRWRDRRRAAEEAGRMEAHGAEDTSDRYRDEVDSYMKGKREARLDMEEAQTRAEHPLRQLIDQIDEQCGTETLPWSDMLRTLAQYVLDKEEGL